MAAIILISATATVGAETPLERGTYLMQGIVACGNCHSSRTPEWSLIDGMEMAGNLVVVEEMFTAYALNITPDVETGIGGWSDAEINTAIREGLRPDGTIIGPPIPISVYRGFPDTDARTLVAYLRALPQIQNTLPKPDYRTPPPPSYGPPVGSVPDVPRDDPLVYGAYLAGQLGHCFEYHSPLVNGRPDWETQPGAGGMHLPGPWGISVTANITSHPEDGIAHYSDADITRAINQGLRPDGSGLSSPMGFSYYANISEPDSDALVLICEP